MKKVFRYSPDILIQIGIFLESITLFRKTCRYGLPSVDCGGPDWKIIIPIILVTLGLNIAIRQYSNKR